MEAIGIIVRRPEPVDHKKQFSTPTWSSRGFCNSCPRDAILVVGDEIIETPMVWPCRYFETLSYRPILKDYFRRGARWTAAPKPQITDELFDPDFRLPEKGQPVTYILTEFEPVFDAADFVRCGCDLFVMRSNVTNALGIEWLRRHLGPTYRIHQIESRCSNPMHIDTTILPLAPGKLLVIQEYIDIDHLPDILKKWDILIAPEPDPIENRMLKITSLCGKWLNMNVLTIDEKRVIVDPHHTGMVRALEKWGLNRSLASSCTMPHSVELFIVLRWTSAGEVHCKAISDPGYDRRDRWLLAGRRQHPIEILKPAPGPPRISGYPGPWLSYAGNWVTG